MHLEVPGPKVRTHRTTPAALAALGPAGWEYKAAAFTNPERAVSNAESDEVRVDAKLRANQTAAVTTAPQTATAAPTEAAASPTDAAPTEAGSAAPTETVATAEPSVSASTTAQTIASLPTQPPPTVRKPAPVVAPATTPPPKATTYHPPPVLKTSDIPSGI